MDPRTLAARARCEWESHACGDAEPGRGNLEKQRLTDVRHTTHLADAYRILTDGRIRAASVGRDSRLYRTRRSVTWLSANQWWQGSIYGNVEFTFDWRTIVADRKLYWVETVPYDTPAYRILLTDRPAPKRLAVRYNPRKHRGPIVRAGEKWFWNGDRRVSEFMLQDDLPLERCKSINFVEHRHGHCKDYGLKCPDATLNRSLAGFLTIAFVLASSSHAADAILRREHGWLSPVDEFVNEFVRHLAVEADFRPRSGRPHSAHTLMRAILALWSYRDYQSAYTLAERFSEKAFRKTLIAVVRRHFGEPRYQPKSGRDFVS